MPVIACPDCGRDVSTLATACPHCGRPSPAATAPVSPQAATPVAAEETIWRGSPAWTLVIGRVIFMAVITIFIPLFAYLLAGGADDDASRAALIKGGWVIAIAADLILLAWFSAALIRLRSTTYTVTNQRVLVETGVLTKSVHEIDMRLIDDTTFFQTFLHRLLGIGDVTVMSSDKTTPSYTMRGVRDPRGVRELIRTHSYHASQRQVFTRST